MPIPISLELLVILWPLKMPYCMIYLLLLCVFRYGFAVVEPWAFSDLVIHFLFLSENPSRNINILTVVETSKFYLNNCSVWFPNFNCLRQFFQHLNNNRKTFYRRLPDTVKWMWFCCRQQDLGGRSGYVGLGRCHSTAISAALWRGKRWKGMNRKGRAGEYLHVEKQNTILKRKKVSFLFLFFKPGFVNLFYFLCLAF